MLVSFFLIALITVGGFGWTYLFSDDETWLWRVAAGCVGGSAVFGLVIFALACFFGLTIPTVAAALLLTLAPLAVFTLETRRARLKNDWETAKSKLDGANLQKALRFGYYVFFLILFWQFFDRAMLENAQGIFTGASQNTGDLPFHLGAIFSFTDGGNFPPENPSFAFAKFSYPFMADLIASAFIAVGANLRGALFAQNITLAMSLLVILERFTVRFTGSRTAGKIAPSLLFFCGGLGFYWFFKDYWHSGQSLPDFLWKMPRDYTIGDDFRWGNSLIVLFITQRSLLLGMPLTLMVTQKLWEIFAVESPQKSVPNISESAANSSDFNRLTAAFISGLLAGTLPLIHVHSLAVLFVVSAFAFFFRLDKWREWLVFGAGVAIIAVPELIWTMTGSATRLTEFIGWNFGWDKRDLGFVWFWLKNTGVFFPLLLAALFVAFKAAERNEERAAETEDDGANEKSKNTKTTTQSFYNLPFTAAQMYFYLPFLFCFVVANLYKFAPWSWDNIKILIYWFVVSMVFVAALLAKMWSEGAWLKIAAAACFAVLITSGALDVWRTASDQINYQLFSRNAVAVAEQIKDRTAPQALFLNAPTYNSAIVLSGRRSLMRYTGHLASYGIDFGERENDVRQIYAGAENAETLLRKYGIEYVIVSPEERTNLPVNEEFFSRFPVVAEAGDRGEYRVYRVAN